MIAFDTNLIVRAILGDNARQAAAVEREIKNAVRRGSPIFLSDIVLCELVWVLGRSARLARAIIAAKLADLLATELNTVTDEEAVGRAIEAYRTGKGDFADYLLRERALAAGATEVLTFDSALRGEAGFRVLAT